MKKIILILIITLGLASCEKEERVIDNSKISLDLYLADSITNDVITVPELSKSHTKKPERRLQGFVNAWSNPTWCLSPAPLE